MVSRTAPVADGEPTTISDLPCDVLAHILRLLDGPTLASASCASSRLHALSSDLSIWHHLCRSTWPSSDHPRVSQLISTVFPNAYRTFFSDSFPLLPLRSIPSSSLPVAPHHLISAVDIHYSGSTILSKVLDTETRSNWFFSSPFRIDAHDRKEPPTILSHANRDSLAADLTLSWILIDPVRGRAANVSSLRPVSVNRHWFFSGEIQVRFATVLERSSEWVACGIVVTCGECEEKGGGLQVREVSMQVEDMDGMGLNGRESLVILQGAIEGDRGAKEREEDGMRERYVEYLKRKRERNERKLRWEGMLDLACVILGVSVLSSLLWFIFLW